jgi:hypothetical protein
MTKYNIAVCRYDKMLVNVATYGIPGWVGVCVHVHAHAWVCVVCVPVHTCACGCARMCMHVRGCVCMRVCVCVCVCVVKSKQETSSILTRSIPLCVITISTTEYSLARQYVFQLTN